MEITIVYSAVDRTRIVRKYKTLKGAQTFAQKMVGRTPEMSPGYYAISGDGIGKVEVQGVFLHELFPAIRVPAED